MHIWGGGDNYKTYPSPNPIQVFIYSPNPLYTRIGYSHTHPNKGGAGRVTWFTYKIVIPNL